MTSSTSRGRGRVRRTAGPPSAKQENIESSPKQEVAPEKAAAPKSEIVNQPAAGTASEPQKSEPTRSTSERTTPRAARSGSERSTRSGEGTSTRRGGNRSRKPVGEDSTRSGGSRPDRSKSSGAGRGESRSSSSGAQGGNKRRENPSYTGVQSMQGTDMTVRLSAPPAPVKNSVRVVALGGISEIGRNMTVFEHKRRLLIIDCGVLFPSSGEPGVDLILPDFGYVEDRLHQVDALVLTHAHEDHIGAIPFLLKLRPDIPVVGSRFTLALVAAKCREHRIKPKFIQVAEGETSTHGPFEVSYFAVNHSIPDALGIVVKTSAGTIMHTGDIKLDQLPMDNRPTDLPAMARYGDNGVDLLLLDSTNATTPGFSPSESEISPALRRLILEAKQLVIVACFASNVYRVQQIIDSAVETGRRVALIGRSMVRNMDIAQELGFLTAPDGVIVDMDSAAKLPAEKLVIITTGTQGEAMAGLSRMSRREHRQITVREGDRVILASSLVPGNEEAVFGVINSLSQIGVQVITNSDAKVHVSGHGFSGELLFIYNAVRPKNVMPVHGEWRHLRANKALAESTGIPEDNVVLAQNGVCVDLVDGKATVVGQVPVGNLYVDGLSMGDVGDSVLADRTTLGEGGFITATVVVDPRTGRPVSRPQIMGKGFTEEPGALDPVVELVENVLLNLAGEGENDPYRMAQAVRRTIGTWVAEKWRRKPMIVPTIVTSAVAE